MALLGVATAGVAVDFIIFGCMIRAIGSLIRNVDLLALTRYGTTSVAAASRIP